MKIQTNKELKNLKGDIIKNEKGTPVTFGYYLGEILLADKSGGKMKLFILAQKCATQDSVEVDESDLAMIKSAVEKTEIVSNLVSGQLLVYLESLKYDKKN